MDKCDHCERDMAQTNYWNDYVVCDECFNELMTDDSPLARGEENGELE